jgi:tRNA-uridine 2-sulfurtransferase
MSTRLSRLNLNGISNKKVIIALSGGVDSSVAAALLKKKGCNVTGLYLRLFNDAKKEKQVRKIARAIGIALVIKDVRQEFEKKVIGYFLQEYRAGRTPNPCIVCNKEIKFKFLFKELFKRKADYIATGHYARLRREFPISNFQFPNKSKITNSKFLYKLLEAKDKTKDQSYFLYTLKQKQLSKILFPLGNYKKTEIIKLAERLNIIHNPSADGSCRYKESQNICFIPDKYPDGFLRKHIKMKSGKIVDWKGNAIGRHQGLPLYTLGQRRGINIGGKGPYFVVAKNIRKNELVVASGRTIPELFQVSRNLTSVNWVSIEPKLPAHISSQTRYHNPKVNAIIKAANSRESAVHGLYKIEFEKPQRAVTPGQSAVFYSKKGEIIGGGRIV